MKRILLAGSLAAVSVVGLVGGAARAASQSATSGDGMSNLVNAIATKFNLNKADVQKVFDDQRSQMQQQRENEIKNEISQLVKDGKLTQAQADAINTKRAELESQRDANRTADQNLTASQRKAKMDTQKTALDAWLKTNGIDTKYAYLLMGGGHGHGGPDGDGPRGSASSNGSSPSTSTSTN